MSAASRPSRRPIRNAATNNELSREDRRALSSEPALSTEVRLTYSLLTAEPRVDRTGLRRTGTGTVTHDADRNAIVDVGPSHQRESGEHVRITLPSACGNSPRITIVGELVARWANRDAEAPAVRAAEDVRWTIDGREAGHSPGAVEHAFPDGPVDLLEVASIITHGRLASCDGIIESSSGRLSFSHVFRSAGASRTTRITEVRSYVVDPTA
jgi:hypothetical protein